MKLIYSNHGLTVLIAPLERADIEQMMLEKGYVSANIAVPFNDVLGGGIDTFDDVLSESMTGDPTQLEDIDFRPIDILGDDMVVFEVSGRVDCGRLDRVLFD